MDLSLWLAFAAASLVMAVIPGPGVASIIGFAFSSGTKVALTSVAGMAFGNAIAMTVSLAGAGLVLASSPLAFTVLKWTGGLYLIVIGTIAIARAGKEENALLENRAISARSAFLTNVAVGTFHPKTIIFFVAFAAQFIHPGAPFLLQAAILVATFTVTAGVTDTIYALAASHAAGLVRGPTFRRWTTRIGGVVLVTAGVATAVLRI